MPFFGQNLSFLPLNLARGLKMNQFLFQLVTFLITLLLIPILIGKLTQKKLTYIFLTLSQFFFTSNLGQFFFENLVNLPSNMGIKRSVIKNITNWNKN